MDKITQLILQLWTWIISIFAFNTKKSMEPEATGFYRAIIVGFKLAGRLVRYDIVPHRDESGGFHCAILQRVGSPALAPHVLQAVAKFISRDYFHRVVDSLSWVYIPLRSESVTPEDVLEFQFERGGTNGNMRVTWSVAAPEVARAWISRAALAIEFGTHISVR
jgi:hypothetical protein